MKTICWSVIVSLSLALVCSGQIPSSGPVSTNSPGASGVATNSISSVAFATNQVVVAAPQPPVDPSVSRVIRPTADGAAADFAAHKVSFAANANTAGAIQIQLPQPSASANPVVLTSHVVGLCYWLGSGPNAGQSVMIASLTDSTGEILPPTTVHYPDALGPGFGLLYNYSQSSIEQDLIINVQLPVPASVLPAATDESTVMLGVMTS